MRIKIFAAFLASFALCFNSFNRVTGEPGIITEESEEIAFQKLLKMEKGMKDSIKKLIDQALPLLMNSNSSIELSGPCMGSIFKMIGSFAKLKLWPIKMLDAIGIPSGGLLSGAGSPFGSYQQCIDIVIPTMSKTNKPNVGQYCIIEINGVPLPPKPHRLQVNSNVFPHINATFESEIMKELVSFMPLLYAEKINWGVCLPSTCTIPDIKQVLELVTIKIGLNMDVRRCEVKEALKMDMVQTAIVSVLCICIVVNILSTLIYEIQLYRSETNQTMALNVEAPGFWITATSYFSMRHNFVNLMRTNEATPRSLDSINGIKFITMTWVVLCHSYIFTDPRFINGARSALEIPKDFAFQVIANGFLSVSTFFFLTALLLAHNIVKRHDAGKAVNPIVSHFRRCYRITLVMLLAIGFTILSPLFGSGPLYKEATTNLAGTCRVNWWKNMLFIHNYFDYSEMCEGATWYLAVDIQCFIFGLLYLFILFKNEAMAKVFLILASLCSCAGSAYVTYVNDFPPSPILTIIDRDHILDYTKKTYTQSYQYMGLYSFGLFLGTYVARAPQIKIKKFIALIGWILAFGMGLTIVYSVHPWNSGESYTMLEAISYSSLNRLGWAIAVGWVILACFSGRGGVINDLLSWPGFQPLVRLSYIVYLTHTQVYKFYTYTQQGPSYISQTACVFKFLACLVLSHIIAVFIRVLYEYPLLKIEDDVSKWLEGRQTKRKEVPDVSVDLSNGIATLKSEMKYNQVKLNKVTVNGVQFTTEKDNCKEVIPNNAENHTDTEKPNSLEDSSYASTNENKNEEPNKTGKLNFT